MAFLNLIDLIYCYYIHVHDIVEYMKVLFQFQWSRAVRFFHSNWNCKNDYRWQVTKLTFHLLLCSRFSSYYCLGVQVFKLGNSSMIISRQIITVSNVDLLIFLIPIWRYFKIGEFNSTFTLMDI